MGIAQLGHARLRLRRRDAELGQLIDDGLLAEKSCDLLLGGRGFDGFNLSDIFEYLDTATCEKIYGTLLRMARPGARLAYWNMLAPRKCPGALLNRIRPLEQAERLFRQDMAFFYSTFVLEEVL